MWTCGHPLVGFNYYAIQEISLVCRYFSSANSNYKTDQMIRLQNVLQTYRNITRIKTIQNTLYMSAVHLYPNHNICFIHDPHV